MKDSQKVFELVNKHGFNEGTAIAYLESKGKCVYCDKNLLEGLSDFYAADIDHLLPKSMYPEIEWDINNWVLSCRACNSIKGKMNISNLSWTPTEAIKNHKKELIAMFRTFLQERRNTKELEFKMIKEIIQIVE